MGSGASKKQRPSQTKHSSSTAVVAEIVVPGQSQPVKVKGHIASGFDRSSALGAAKLTEVAPSKYKVKIGNQDIGTFDAPNSDFQSYLQEAASVTVTNIETVGDDNDDINFTPESSPLHIPLQRQISGVVYSDDEDWENVATSLDGSDPKTPSPSLAKEDAKERRAKIKQAIKEKKEKLSQQEYQQMIANHKQEMELMEILREREKERHQLKLGSKVAERKKRRAARIAEKKEQEKLLAENMRANSQKEEEDKLRTSDQHAVTLEIEKKVSKFHREVQSRKENFSEAEYEKLLKQHEEEVALLERRLNQQIGTQKRSFLDKLAARKRKKSEKALTAVELQELEAELQEMQKQFDIELKEKKGLSSDDDYKKLIAQHKMELGQMQEKLALQRQKQRQEMLDKLAARRNMRESGIEENLSADEVKELQLALNQRAISFKDELKDAKTKMSAGDCQRMIDRHRSEMEEMQSQLDEERDRMRQQLMTKLNQRKKTTKGQHGSSQEKCFSPEELKQLQLMMDIKNTSEKQKIAGQKNKISAEKYRELLDQHHKEMKSMEERLERERELSDQRLRQKLAARRAQRPTSAVNVEMEPEDPTGEDNMSTTQDVQKLEREILMKEATFQAEVEKKRSKMSDADYQRLLAQHQKEIDTLRNKLKLSQDRQKQHFQDKLAERRKRRGEVFEADDQSVHSIVNLEEEIKVREATFQTAVEDRRGQLSDGEYRRLLEQHQREMQDLREKLRLSQERQRQHFQDKLDERRRRRRGMISHEQERKELLSLFDNDGNRLEEDEIKQVEKEINDYDSLVESSIAGKKGQISQAEINKLMEEHARNMEDFKGRLALEKQRMLDALREKRAARKLKLESEADFVNIMSILEKNQTKDLETLSEEDLNHLEEDLKKYSRAIHESLESNRGVFSNEELDLMISEHRRNMESLENRLENERLRMEEKMRRKLAMRQAQIVTTVEDEREIEEVAAIYYQDEVSSSSEDEDEDEELEDLPELNQTMAKLVATQFWTTPIQSNDVLIVPLAEEYPVKKKRELYTDPSIFRELDAHAIRLAQTVSLVTQPTFSSLVNELTSIGITELEKARLIFRWITAQNCDEMNLNDVVDDTPLGVLKGLYQKKITFSTLFMRMCRFVGLQCVEITGIAKMKGYTPGTEISFRDPSHHHTWNAVRIDGYWHFIDCNWGVSHIPGSVTFDPFRFEYDEHYFLADPEVIISSHFPNDSSWQLLQEAVTLEVFNKAVLLKPDFFKYGFGLQDHTQAVLQAPYGEINIKITCPLGFLLSCRLSEAYSGSEKSSQGILYDQYEFIHQVGDNVMACYVRIPDVGAFHLTLFAKRQFINGELNVESPTEICRYLIYCHAPSKDVAPLPLAPADHWGPIGVMNAGLVPVSHRTGVIFSQDNRDIHIVFEMTMKMSFYHSLTAWGKDESHLKPYAMQRNVNNQLIVTFAPPRPDRYGLHIFVVYQGHSNPAHLCSYLVVANSARPSVQPFPLLREHEQWGPTKAFDGLELFPISNVDPFIVAEGSILIIEVGHYQQREFMFHFYHEGREMHQDVQMQTANQQCSFVVDLKPKGFFVLKIFAKEAHLQGIPFTHVFNYLIQKI